MAAKWAVVADELRNRISSGRLTGEIPSEAALMAEFEVSRNTVRSALDRLQTEGLIEGSQGTRRKVRTDDRICWPMHSWENNHTADADAWAESVRAQGGTPEAEVSVAVEAADANVAAALNLEPGETVVVRRRVRRIDGAPHQLADSYFPMNLVKDYPPFMLPGDQSAPGGLLRAAGLPQERLLDVIESRMPTPDETRVLAIPTGTPLLVHRRTGFMKDGTAVRYMVTRMAANRVEISYEVPA